MSNKTDGTSSGTVLVKDTREDLSIHSSLTNLTAVGSKAFFSVNDGVHGMELWVSDGTAVGTARVPGIGRNLQHSFVNVGGMLYFRVDTLTQSDSLLKSDGTAEGTKFVKAFRSLGTNARVPGGMVEFQGNLFFVAKDDDRGLQLHRSDGTPNGTRIVELIHPNGDAFSKYYNPHFTVFDGLLYFVADDGIHGKQLWRTDGTGGPKLEGDERIGTELVAETVASGTQSWPSTLAVAGAALFVGLEDLGEGAQLWKTDGTGPGTSAVPNSEGRTASMTFGLVGEASGYTYFTASMNRIDYGLWKTDGTQGGTILLKDGLVAASTERQRLVNVNGTVFFVANDGVSGLELWKSDGTKEGTTLVKDIRPGAETSRPLELVNVNGTLLFSANDGTHGFELWRSDGTAAGTVLVRDLSPGSSDAYPHGITDVNGEAFFSTARLGGLWRSNGTSVGTLQISDLAVDPGKTNRAFYLTNVNGFVYFTADAGGSYANDELWKSDGTAEGTGVVKDIIPGLEGGDPSGLTNVNGKLLFIGPGRSSSGREIWTSDGTSTGTVMVKDFGCCIGSDPRYPTSVGGMLFYRAYTGISSGYDIYRSDGTEAGTFLVRWTPKVGR